jgi:hypothetical protein
MLVHARLPDTYAYHDIMYTTVIFNVLPIKGLVNAADIPATPIELFTGEQPAIGNLRVFGCPVRNMRQDSMEKWRRKQQREESELFLLTHLKIKKGI